MDLVRFIIRRRWLNNFYGEQNNVIQTIHWKNDQIKGFVLLPTFNVKGFIISSLLFVKTYPDTFNVPILGDLEAYVKFNTECMSQA